MRRLEELAAVAVGEAHEVLGELAVAVDGFLEVALLRPGLQRDLDTAAARGLEAIDIAESLHSTYSVELLRNLYHQMIPYAKVPAVGDFLDRARGLVAV